MCGFINNRVRHGWDFTDWPELRVCEERHFRDAWQAAVAYTAGDEVWYGTDEKYYLALDASTNVTPGTNPAVWEEIGTLERYIPWIMRDAYPLGTVYQISRENPFQYASRLFSYGFSLGTDGVWVHDCNLDSVWIVFRPKASRYTRTAHSDTGTYSSGDLVYMSANGEVYQAALVGGVQTWLKVEFPEFLASYVAWAAAGDWMLWNGERERADRAWIIADQHLRDLEIRELDQPGQRLGLNLRGQYW